MDKNEFWTLIALLDGRVEEDGIRAVDDQLHRLGTDAADAFAARLKEHLDQLTVGPTAASLRSRFGREFSHHSDDELLAVACAIVARGQAAYAATVANPDLVELPLPSDGDLLLRLLSHELLAADEMNNPAPRAKWLSVSLGGDSDVSPRWLHEVAATAARDRVVRRGKYDEWLTSSGIEYLLIHLTLTAKPEREYTKVLTKLPSPSVQVDAIVDRTRAGGWPRRVHYERLIDQALLKVQEIWATRPRNS